MVLPDQRLVVFDALMLKRYASGDANSFQDELEAFQVPFRRRRFRMLLTTGILDEYQKEADKAPQFQLQPILNTLSETGTTIYRDEYHLNRGPIELTGLTKRHQSLIRDAISGGAAYLITIWPMWLKLSQQAETKYGLNIVTPAKFVELEG